jgi:hypothetical protein
VSDQAASEAVAHQDQRAETVSNGALQFFKPIIQLRLFPVILLQYLGIGGSGIARYAASVQDLSRSSREPGECQWSN